MQILARMQGLTSNSYWARVLNKQYTEIVCVHTYVSVYAHVEDSELIAC